MMLRIAFSSLALLLAVAVSATAAPPETGTRAPKRTAPKPIASTYVGFALSGPRSYCEEPSDPDGDGVFGAGCFDVVQTRCRLWRRSGGEWRPAGAIRNDDPRVFFVAPYGGGYHWMLSTTFGFRAIATRCLARWAPDA